MSACYIINQKNFPSLTEDYVEFPCDEINRHYASFTFFRWTDPDTNPTFTDFHSAHNISITLRGSEDPYVVGFTKVDLVKDKEDNKILLIGLLIGIISLVALIIPIKLIMTEESLSVRSSRDKMRFMNRV